MGIYDHSAEGADLAVLDVHAHLDRRVVGAVPQLDVGIERAAFGAQDHLKGKMFRVGSMGETPVAEMIEGCKRMIACFRDFGVDLKEVDVESYFG